MATMVGTQKDLVSLLNQLLELDYDAIEAYKAAIARLKDTADRAQLASYMHDHERHIRELGDEIVAMGARPSNGPDMKQVLTKGKVVLSALIGDRLILIAMRTNENDTNTAYERAVDRTDLPQHLRAILERNLTDERRHRAWLAQRIEVLNAAAHP
ncbi:ferritin-like domain-containing protein [Pendulispora rubella]|uniref:Ferritin-like domain-containing protein n=1 Tax=Pendulispora rubella TaxID=2741070 RepID=A0ABZ2KSR5_9BACT